MLQYSDQPDQPDFKPVGLYVPTYGVAQGTYGFRFYG